MLVRPATTRALSVAVTLGSAASVTPVSPSPSGFVDAWTRTLPRWAFSAPLRQPPASRPRRAPWRGWAARSGWCAGRRELLRQAARENAKFALGVDRLPEVAGHLGREGGAQLGVGGEQTGEVVPALLTALLIISFPPLA